MFPVITPKSRTYLDMLRYIKIRQNYSGDFERDEEVAGILFPRCQNCVT
jgi:hypothetical protein